MKIKEVKLNNIHLVSSDQVYEWVKTDQWSKRDFSMWLDMVKHQSFKQGVHAEGGS